VFLILTTCDDEIKRRPVIMSKIEKRELIEQQCKILEAGAQRADKRTGSFSFLSWSFFIAPLIASKESLAAAGKSLAAAEEDAAAAQKGAALHAADDDPLAPDLSRTSGQKEIANGPAALSAAHAPQVDPIGLAAQPHEGGNDADWPHHPSSDDSSVYSLPVDSHLGSSPLPGGSALESVQSDGLGGSFTPSVVGSGAEAIANAEAATPPVLATAGDTVETPTQDVAGTLAPAEAAAPPVLATAGDTADTLTNDVTIPVAPVEAAASPVPAAVGDTADMPTKDVAGTPALNPSGSETLPATETVASNAPEGGATEPVITTVAVQGDPSSEVSHPADTLLALATATDSPIQVPESATAAPADTAATVQPTDVAGDVIALNDAPPPPADTLFTGTQYTQYGITLSSGGAASPQDATSLADATSQQNSAPAVADVQQQAPPPDIVDPTHSTDHLAHAIL
jgi:hypothetical protein